MDCGRRTCWRLQDPCNVNNGENGIIDLKEAIYHDNRPVFKELTDTEKFSQLKVDFDTIVWDNGLDLAPEYLFDLLKHSQHVR